MRSGSGHALNAPRTSGSCRQARRLTLSCYLEEQQLDGFEQHTAAGAAASSPHGGDDDEAAPTDIEDEHPVLEEMDTGGGEGPEARPRANGAALEAAAAAEDAAAEVAQHDGIPVQVAEAQAEAAAVAAGVDAPRVHAQEVRSPHRR